MGTGGSKELALVEGIKEQLTISNVISLQGNHLDETSVGVLSSMLRDPHVRGRVRHLRVGGCGINGMGLQRIAEALCIATEPCKLKRLDLSRTRRSQVGNPLGKEGANFLALIISRAPYLQHVIASNCNLGDEGMKHIGNSLINNGHLLTLDLSDNKISEEGARFLGRALESNYHLKGLQLWKNRIFHTGADALAKGLTTNSTLEWIGLGCNQIGDAGALAFAELFLSDHSALKWLAIGANGITSQGAKHLGMGLRSYKPSEQKQAMNSLRELQSQNPSKADPPLNRLRRETLKSSSESSLSHAGSTQEYTVNQSLIDAEVENEEDAEAICSNLESLGLGGNAITDDGIVALSEALESNFKLQSLGLADNCIGNKGAKVLAELIRKTATLKRLVLSGNTIKDEGASQVVAALTQNISLKQLFMANNPFGDAVVKRCMEVLGRHNESLEKLDIHGTHVSREYIEMFILNSKDTGVLRVLGSERVPASLARGFETPSSGNVLELASVIPSESTDMPPTSSNRKTGLFLDHPQSQGMSAFFGSLPPPEETAQALVMKNKSRKASISQMFRRMSRSSSSKFRQGEVADISGGYEKSNVQRSSQEHGGSQGVQRRPSRGRQIYSKPSKGKGVYEMQTLSEEGFQEDIHTRQPKMSTTPFQTNTLVVGEGLSDPDSDQMPHSPTDSVKRYIITDKTKHGAPDNTTEKYRKRREIDDVPPVDVSVHVIDPVNGAGGFASAAPKEIKQSLSSEEELEPFDLEVTSALRRPSSVGRDTSFVTGPPSVYMDDIRRQDSLEHAHIPKQNHTHSSRSHVNVTRGALDSTSEAYTRGKAEVYVNEEAREDHFNDPAFDIPRTPSLRSLTKDRPKPPPGRRRPTKPSSLLSSFSSADYSRSPSDSMYGGGGGGIEGWRGKTINILSESDYAIVKNERRQSSLDDEESVISSEGIEDIDAARLPQFRQSIMADVKNVGSSGIVAKSVPIMHSEDPELASVSHTDGKPLKEQWTLALAMRVGVIKMGGFLHSVFEGIEKASERIEHDFTAARLPANSRKNRSRAPLPPGKSRVKLALSHEVLGSDYINANFVGPPTKDRMFIVTQAPLNETVGDFWRMVWEESVHTICMVTMERENGKSLSERYWPDSEFDDSYPLVISGAYVDDALSISLVSEERISIPGVILRTLRLCSSLNRGSRIVMQYQYLNWPQQGTPSCVEDVAALILHLEKDRNRSPNDPMVIHSSLGAGRAGCIAAVAIAKVLIQSESEPWAWDSDSNLLDQVIRGIRERRSGLVENSKQFEFCHKVLEQCLWGQVAKQQFQSSAKEKDTKNKWWQFGKKKDQPKASTTRKKKETPAKAAVASKEKKKKKKKSILTEDFLY